jgi:hypothetical protein
MKMTSEHTHQPFVLDDEQRRRVADCLRKDGIELASDRLGQLICDIEESIANFLADAGAPSFPEARNALSRLWKLSHEDDPPIGLIRVLIRKLPAKAKEYLDQRFPFKFSNLYQDDEEIEFQTFAQFEAWAGDAEPSTLVLATRVVTAKAAQIVEGRSRGQGKRSGPKIEPIIERVPGGGRPRNAEQQDLVMYLALDWVQHTGEMPTSGRSDHKGFGELVHSVFQWLALPEGSAAYALRQYWAEVRHGTAKRELSTQSQR